MTLEEMEARISELLHGGVQNLTAATKKELEELTVKASLLRFDAENAVNTLVKKAKDA